jgi:hypothetical protein
VAVPNRPAADAEDEGTMPLDERRKCTIIAIFCESPQKCMVVREEVGELRQ